MTAIHFFIILFGIKQLIIIMEEDILNYSPIVMFRGTPCRIISKQNGQLCKCPSSIWMKFGTQLNVYQKKIHQILFGDFRDRINGRKFCKHGYGDFRSQKSIF